MADSTVVLTCRGNRQQAAHLHILPAQEKKKDNQNSRSIDSDDQAEQEKVVAWLAAGRHGEAPAEKSLQLLRLEDGPQTSMKTSVVAEHSDSSHYSLIINDQ